MSDSPAVYEEQGSDYVYAVNLFPAAFPHDDVLVEGTVDGLMRLRALIDEALLAGTQATGGFYDSDGEGHHLHVVVHAGDQIRFTSPCYLSYLQMESSDEK